VVGGTSLLILVGVAIDFSRQLQAQLAMRQYEDFLK
jgi:preprotein translocase subunit SecY